MKLFESKSLIVAAAFACACVAPVVTAAASPQPIAPSLTVANDGYLTVLNSGRKLALPPLFCPEGTDHQGDHGDCLKYNQGLMREATIVKPVTAQEALDLAYGTHKAVVVGIAPSGWQQSVIYFRIVAPVEGK